MIYHWQEENSSFLLGREKKKGKSPLGRASETFFLVRERKRKKRSDSFTHFLPRSLKVAAAAAACVPVAAAAAAGSPLPPLAVWF